MSGIVGSKLNIRGSGLVGSLGTDGQHMLSAGAGKTNVFETVAAGGGKVNQVVSTLKTDTYTLTTEDSFQDLTGMVRAITPSASDSTILVFVNIQGGTNGGATPTIKLQRDIGGAGYADSIAIGDAAGSRTRSTSGTFYSVNTAQLETIFTMWLDSPSTTSEVTYKTQIYSDNTNIVGVNRSGGWGDSAAEHTFCSSITCMEILA